MKKIVFETLEGVKVITPATGVYTNGTDFITPRSGEKVPDGFVLAGIDQIANYALSKRSDATSGYVLIDESDIPQSKEHRSCWKLNGNMVEIDQVKVQKILNEKIKKEESKNLILSKLKITREELDNIIKG